MTTALFACVAENTPAFATLAHNLVISIRGFAGELAEAPIVVSFVDGVDEQFAAPLRAAGAEVRVVERVPGSNPLANKLRMLELPAQFEFDVLVALDCDVVVLADPLAWLDGASLGLRGADVDRFTDGEWRSLFAAVGLSQAPERSLTATATGRRMYPYFNSGVLLAPRELCAPLRASWERTYEDLSELLRDRPDAIREQWHWLAEQSSLALAILRQGLPWRELPAALNFPSHVPVANGAIAGDPVIVHYHGDRDRDGFLLASSTEAINPALHRFNQRRAAVTGLPYTTLPHRSLSARARRETTRRMWAAVADRRWYRSSRVTAIRRRVKALARPPRG